MGVFVGLPVDGVWNGGSDLQAGVEIYYWEHPEFWLISGSQNDPLLGPQFQPPVWSIGGPISFALNGAFCGWPGRGERLLRANLFWGGAGARNQVQSRAEYRCTLLSSSASSQRDLAAPL